MATWLGNFFTGNNSTDTTGATGDTGGTYAGVGQTTPSTLDYTSPTTHVGTTGYVSGTTTGITSAGTGTTSTYIPTGGLAGMGVYNPNQSATISNGYNAYPGAGTIHIAGPNPSIATNEGKIDLNELIQLIDVLKTRLLILTPNFEKMEKYAALKKAYDHYKLMESMIGDEDVNKK